MSANLAFVDDVEFSNSGGSTTIVLPSQNVAAGNLLVLGLRWEGGGVNDATTASIADTAGNTWQTIGHLSTGGGSESERIGLFYTLAAVAHATNVVTATLTASRTFRQADCSQYSYDGTIELGDIGSGLSTTNVVPVTSSPALDAAVGDLAIGWMGYFQSGNVFTPDAGYTARGALGLSALFDQVISAGGTFSPGGSFTVGNDTYVLLTAVFREVGGGAQTISPDGIASAEAFGSVVIASVEAQSITPGGVASAEVFGSAAIADATLSIVAVSIASAEVFGSATLTFAIQTISPTGIPTGAAFGSTVLTGGGIQEPTDKVFVQLTRPLFVSLWTVVTKE